MAFTRVDYERVRCLFGTGLSDRAIARRTGASQGTVRRWRLSSAPPATVLRSDLAAIWTIKDAPAYCYLLCACESDILHVAHSANARAFPQHGPGHKHLRKIELAGWQVKLTDAYPAALIRGLIHSDGCRCINSYRTKLPSGRVAEYSYLRYFFTNHSADIPGHLHRALPEQPNHRNLAVSHRDSVRILERLVGPKA